MGRRWCKYKKECDSYSESDHKCRGEFWSCQVFIRNKRNEVNKIKNL